MAVAMEGRLPAGPSGKAPRLNVTDPIYGLGYLFLGTAAPPPPSRSCGPDRTADDLDCKMSAACP
jgi:hypothetical protein